MIGKEENGKIKGKVIVIERKCDGGNCAANDWEGREREE